MVKKEKKKVYMLADSIYSTTGNARVTKTLLTGLKSQGFNVANIGIGAEGEFEGIKFLPITQHGFDENSVQVFLNKLTKYLERDKPDFLIILGDRVHFQNLGVGNISKDFLEMIGTKMIFWETVDSNAMLCMENTIQNPTTPRKQIYPACTNVVTTSHYGKKVLENEFVKVDKVIWEFVDTERFTPVNDNKKIEIRKEYRFKKDDFVFFMVGRCMRRKNPELVMEALYPLLVEHPNVRLFCLIPDYNIKDDQNLVDFAKRVLPSRYGGRDMIDEQKILFCTVNKQPTRLAAGIDDDEVVKFYQISDAVISGSSNEGFNLVFGETMSCGLPYVGINNTTIPELTSNGKVGFIAPGSVEHHVGQSMVITTTSIEEMREQCKKVLSLSKEDMGKMKEKNRSYIKDLIPKSKMILEWKHYLESISGGN